MIIAAFMMIFKQFMLILSIFFVILTVRLIPFILLGVFNSPAEDSWEKIR